MRSCPCCVSHTPWPHPYCRFIKFPLLLLHLHHILSFLHIACFLLTQPQAATIRSTAGTPTTSVQPAPETAAPPASVGCPQVRLARFYAAKPIISYFYSGVFPYIGTDCAVQMHVVTTTVGVFRSTKYSGVTRMKLHPGDYKFNFKMLSHGVLWEG